MYNLKDKTALITGASRGLGEACARALHRAGARVILAGRHTNTLDDLAKTLDPSMESTRVIVMDVGDKKSVEEACEALKNETLDICLNNAGIAHMTPIFEEDRDEHFESIIHTNLMGVWYVTRAAARHMKCHATPGSIINIASINGDRWLRPGMSAYAASKAGVIQLTKALVGELSPHNIRINCISPGLFHTPLTHYKLKTDDLKRQQSQTIPLNFVADPCDITALVLYLASNEASRYVTGANMTIDGGMSWGGAGFGSRGKPGDNVS